MLSCGQVRLHNIMMLHKTFKPYKKLPDLLLYVMVNSCGHVGMVSYPKFNQSS